jgi:hypothetical protein
MSHSDDRFPEQPPADPAGRERRGSEQFPWVPGVQGQEVVVFTAPVTIAGGFNAFTDRARRPDTGPAPEADRAPEAERIPHSAAAALADVVDRVLASAGPSRAPIVVAVETTDDPLPDTALLRTRRHLTVSLTPEQL